MQLSQPLARQAAAEVYDIDLFDNSATTIRSLHARGGRAVCYLSAGTHESWRPDAAAVPSSLLGKPDWPGERWLDIRQRDALAPTIRRRLDLCKAKGFDGVEFDNVDGFVNDTGFALTADDQLRYNTWLANEAHRRGLAAVLKNDLQQAPQLRRYFDAVLAESCLRYDECRDLAPFTGLDKPAIDVEYEPVSGADCGRLADLGIQVIRKHLSLSPWLWRPCN